MSAACSLPSCFAGLFASGFFAAFFAGSFFIGFFDEVFLVCGFTGLFDGKLTAVFVGIGVVGASLMAEFLLILSSELDR